MARRIESTSAPSSMISRGPSTVTGCSASPDATTRTCPASSDTGRSTDRRNPNPAAIRKPAIITMMPTPTAASQFAAAARPSLAAKRSVLRSACSLPTAPRIWSNSAFPWSGLGTAGERFRRGCT